MSVPIEETLGVLTELVAEGKIRSIGLSNETPWGAMQFLAAGAEPRAVSIQNPYSLVNRAYEVGLAEVSIRERCGLLAYSSLGMGVLTGKYLGGARPEGARLTLFERFDRYSGAHAQTPIRQYVGLARQHGLDPAQMALAFVHSRPFLTSTIIGATTLQQLKTNIDSSETKLSDEVLAGIDAIHAASSNPCP